MGELATTKTDITAYVAQVPDAIKITILLEELGLSYTTRKIDVSQAEQKEAWFLKVNPNGRIPALTDILPDGRKIALFESGSIMQYLVDRYDVDHKISYERGTPEFYTSNSWLFFQTSGVGPMQGQAMHFVRFAPEKFEYPLFRYQTEVRRLFRVLDTHLASSTSGYLVGDRCTIADIALWPWIVSDFWAGIDIAPYPNLKKWEELMMTRPGVANGRHKPDKHIMKELAKDPSLQKTIETVAGKWILGLQDANAKK